MSKKYEVVTTTAVTTNFWDRVYEQKPMTPAQLSAMAFTCAAEATSDTGYEPMSTIELAHDKSIHRLLDMLETCRPDGSKEEAAFIERYIEPFKPERDTFGNLFVKVDVPVGHPTILWSCHTDTVHRHGGSQKVETTSTVAWTSDGSCLGADDTVGIWLAQEMIAAGVPGIYVFHRGEEVGGLGSSWLAKNVPSWFGQFDAAIALDRAGYADVITHQGSQRCCSDAFAKSLAVAIGGNFKPCDRGVFTDTANYTDLIGECTNLSVGYFKQHGPMEHTNLSFAASLRDALVAADWASLVFSRKAGEEDPDDYRYDDKYGFGFGTRDHAYGDLDPEIEDLEDFVTAYPWLVAQYLKELGVTVDELDLYEPGDLTHTIKADPQ